MQYKELIVRVVPRLSAYHSDPEKHIRFCRQQLMLHKPFRRMSELRATLMLWRHTMPMVHSQKTREPDADNEAEVVNYQDDAK